MTANVNLTLIWTVIARASGAISPLVYMLFGAWVARWGQRSQWLKDGTKAEYRELLSTLSKSYNTILKNWPEGLIGAVDGRQVLETVEAGYAGRQVIEDRILIARKMADAKILERWQLLAGERDLSRLRDYWVDLHRVLVEMAHRDMGIE